MEYITLSNGVKMPFWGFGSMIDAADVKQGVLEAIASGCRLLDTAQAYANFEKRQIGRTGGTERIP